MSASRKSAGLGVAMAGVLVALVGATSVEAAPSAPNRTQRTPTLPPRAVTLPSASQAQPAPQTVALAPLSAAQKSAFVASVNALRASVGATVMPQLAWDENLATYAAGVAKSCSVEHSPAEARKNIPGWVGTYVGENVAAATITGLTLGDATNTTKVSAMFDQGLGMWWAEKAHYDLAANTCKPGQVCGHYTQLVWSTSTKIGCAVALCTPQKTFNAPGFTLACELGAGGNTFGQRPYTASSSAP